MKFKLHKEFVFLISIYFFVIPNSLANDGFAFNQWVADYVTDDFEGTSNMMVSHFGDDSGIISIRCSKKGYFVAISSYEYFGFSKPEVKFRINNNTIQPYHTVSNHDGKIVTLNDMVTNINLFTIFNQMERGGVLRIRIVGSAKTVDLKADLAGFSEAFQKMQTVENCPKE